MVLLFINVRFYRVKYGNLFFFLPYQTISDLHSCMQSHACAILSNNTTVTLNVYALLQLES